MKAILLVHGFCGGLYEYRPIISFLKKHGYDKFYEFFYKKKLGQVPINEISRQLNTFVKKNIKEKSIYSIGISQGGIILRYFIQNYNSVKISKCITLCTPHYGSKTAYILSLPGIVDLRPDSRFLQEISGKKHKTRYYGVYTPFDLMVLPGWNAKLSQAKNLKVLSILHPLAFWNKRTLEFILESFKE